MTGGWPELHDLHPCCPPLFWNCPAGHDLQPALPVWSWNLPAPQLLQDPFPLWPLGHALHEVLALFTEHPEPDLQLALFPEFCHCAAGHLAQPWFGLPL